MLRKLVIKQGDPSSQIKHFFKESNCLILHFEKKKRFLGLNYFYFTDQKF